MIGAAIGFLWFNAWPAEVFMGDTGAMALGGTIAAMAIFLKVELLLLLVGGVFVIEALSVMVQVISFKCVGETRVPDGADPPPLRDAGPPWSETKIMVRFWIVAGILCAAGFALFYKYYPQIRPSRCVKALVYYADGMSGKAVVGAARPSAARRSSRSTATLGNEDDLALLDGADVVVKTPGVPPAMPLLAAARERGVPVWSEVELGFRLLPGSRFVGVTGTNGKTTTTALLGAIFRAAGRHVTVAGNIGVPLTSVREADWVVCELSSFQLEDVHLFACAVAVLLNLEPDHLDRYDVVRGLPRREAAHLRAGAARRSSRAGSVSRGSSSRPTTRCRPSR